MSVYVARALILLLALISFTARRQTAPYHGFQAGYCTYYAAKEFDRLAGEPKDPKKWHWRGNAGDWLGAAAKAGWQTTAAPSEAQVGAVAVWSGGPTGHVAVVTQATSTSIIVAEMNWGPEMDKDGKTQNFGKVTTATLTLTRMARGKNGEYPFQGYVLPKLSGPTNANPPSTQEQPLSRTQMASQRQSFLRQHRSSSVLIVAIQCLGESRAHLYNRIGVETASDPGNILGSKEHWSQSIGDGNLSWGLGVTFDSNGMVIGVGADPAGINGLGTPDSLLPQLLNLVSTGSSTAISPDKAVRTMLPSLTGYVEERIINGLHIVLRTSKGYRVGLLCIGDVDDPSALCTTRIVRDKKTGKTHKQMFFRPKVPWEKLQIRGLACSVLWPRFTSRFRYMTAFSLPVPTSNVQEEVEARPADERDQLPPGGGVLEPAPLSDYFTGAELAQDNGAGKPGRVVKALRSNDRSFHWLVHFKPLPSAVVLKARLYAADAGGMRNFEMASTDLSASPGMNSLDFRFSHQGLWPTGSYWLELSPNRDFPTSMPLPTSSMPLAMTQFEINTQFRNVVTVDRFEQATAHVRHQHSVRSSEP